MYTYEGTCMGQKRKLNPLELKLQVVVCPPVWVLRTKLGSLAIEQAFLTEPSLWAPKSIFTWWNFSHLHEHSITLIRRHLLCPWLAFLHILLRACIDFSLLQIPLLVVQKLFALLLFQFKTSENLISQGKDTGLFLILSVVCTFIRGGINLLYKCGFSTCHPLVQEVVPTLSAFTWSQHSTSFAHGTKLRPF